MSHGSTVTARIPVADAVARATELLPRGFGVLVVQQEDGRAIASAIDAEVLLGIVGGPELRDTVRDVNVRLGCGPNRLASPR